MTVSTSTSRIAYDGNGVTTSFPVPFPFIQDDYLVVIRTIIATGVETILTLDSIGADGYSVNGAGGPSGNVVVVTAPTALERLTIIRSVPATQEADFVANDPLPSEVIEDSLDKLTMLFGDIAGAEGLSRVPKLYAGDIDGSGRYNSNGNRYANAADGVDPSDLATVQQVVAAGSGNFIQAGTGAVIRTMQDKAREIVTDADFGAAFQAVLHVRATGAQTNGPNVQLGGTTTGGAIASDISNSVLLNPGSTGYNNIIGGTGANVNTTTPNTTTAGTGAHVSVVGGYDNVAGALSSKIISDHSKIVPSSGVLGQGHNAIYGGTTHVIGANVGYSTIIGGKDNTINDAYTAFASGSANTLSGTGSAVFGAGNTLSANYTFAAGNAHVVSGVAATALGSINVASENFTVATGNFSKAALSGQRSHAGGRRSVTGDQQYSDYPIRGYTTNATLTVLGSVGAACLAIPESYAAAFDVVLVARSSAGDVARWTIKGLINRDAGGSAALVGVPTITMDFNTAGAATWVAAISAASNLLQVRGTGEVGKNISWSGYVHVAETIV